MSDTGLYIDTHVHLDRCNLPEGGLAAARAAGTKLFVVPGVTSASWEELLRFAQHHTDVRIAPGLHPLAAQEWDSARAERLATLLQLPQTVAIGEIGLDACATASASLQETVFRAQLQLAIRLQRPVVIHSRQRIGRVLDILLAEGAARVGGIVHAFTGSMESAQQLIDLGFALGIGAPLTWPEARRMAALVRALPEEALVLETDAPDRAPHPHRGTPNRPEYLPLIAARLAALRGWSIAETARITTNNARRVLRLELD